MMPSLQILQGDCLEMLKTLPGESVHCCVTSPPYWGLRDYGVAGQIGLEPTPEAYVAKIVEVFREVRRVLRSDGTCWVNLGSSYATSGIVGQGGGWAGENADNYPDPPSQDRSGFEPRRLDFGGFKPKDMVPIPWMVAMALQKDGWWLRQDIIWSKPNPMPESVTDRCTKAHEYVFLLSKSATYFYDAEAIKEIGAGRELFGNSRSKGPCDQRQDNDRQDMTPTETRNKRSVWTIPSQAFNGDVSYGKCRIASPSCSVHDYQADLVLARQYGEQLIASQFDRNPDSGARPFQAQEGAFVAIPLNQSASLSGFSSAISRSSEIHKKEFGLRQDAIFYGISECDKLYTRQVLRSVAKFFRIHESKTSEDVFSDETEPDPSVQIPDRIVGILTFEKIPHSCSCHYAGTVEKRQDHFACFPEDLVKPCILAGTSARGCCPKCGAPWERVVEKSIVSISDSPRYSGCSNRNDESDSRIERATQTTGWTLTCSCGCSSTVPCSVLDPFGGSCTTGQVALELGRNAVLIELNPAYVTLGRKRCHVTPSLPLA